ncbi:MAG: MlaE family lipid ABC transporter permease subunit [Betaproteobacteria bacterium]|nr:MAG: MlaE family lipid ABC transporter permease subunit [Betaproteobacteria bacterium]
MNPLSLAPAAIAQPTPGTVALSGHWTALGIDAIDRTLDALVVPPNTAIVLDGSGIEGLDTAGIWILQKLLQRLRNDGHAVQFLGWPPRFSRLLALGAAQRNAPPPATSRPGALARIGRDSAAVGEEARALLAFIGESAAALAGSIARPARIRWRPVLYNIQSAGFRALPIVGLLSFLLGIVVAYQGADTLRRYGANIYVADLVGLSMLREFAPLITAIIVAGRSGSAYAAQIGTMQVTEEIDAMRTIGIAPLELLVLPKIIALLIAMPLLTVYADMLGVFGGMIMARAQLGVDFGVFFDRLTYAADLSTYLVGISKAPVFALIIAVTGCFQGFRTQGSAASVGRQTTRSVVQAIFLVIVADALFSVAFSILGI